MLTASWGRWPQAARADQSEYLPQAPKRQAAQFVVEPFASRSYPLDRRAFLSWSVHGLGGAALVSLLAHDGLLGAPAQGDAFDPPPHHRPKAKRAIQIFLNGGLSQVDSFDYKPELFKRHGQPLGGSERPDVFFGKVGLLHKSFWEFRQRGRSGLWISDLFPHLAGVADELTIIHSMVAETSNHTPATFQGHTGFRLNGFPVMGAWLSYGLGAETDDLPAFVVLPDSRGVPAGGSINWSQGFLPARHQGVALGTSGPVLRDLAPARPIDPKTEAASRELLAAMNRRHLEQRAGDDALLARIRSYELAARMQLAVPEATDLSKETVATHELYGLTHTESADFGRGCLMARRLLERGVRFVQLMSGGAFSSPRINWDGHEDIPQNHGQEAGRIDRALAGLLRDLRQRGMLDETLVIFCSEFGRTPFTQSDEGVLGRGRDHNQYGFTTWLAGAGLRPGISYGATDDAGLKAVEKPVTWHDFHATILHLLGIDHKRLTFYHNGIRRRLTDVSGEIVREILA
jgi:hypothetical protein